MTAARTILGELDQVRRAALINADIAQLDQIYSNDLLLTHNNGLQENKATMLGKLAAGKLRYRSIDWIDDKLDVFHDVAIQTGSVLSVVDIDGVEKTLRSSVILVWVRSGGRWCLRNYQTTMIVGS